MDDTGNRVLVGFIIWASAVAGFLCSFICSGSPRVLALGNTFGGGVLLAAGLVHLTTDSFEDFEEAPEDSWTKRYDFPWATFFVALGFLMTLFVEECVLHLLEKGEAKITEGSLTEPLKSPNRSDTEYTGQEKQRLLDSGCSAGCKSEMRKSSALSVRMTEAALVKHDHDHGAGEVINRGMAVASVFLLAISCHSFLAGLGVGALTGDQLWSGMAAIVAHKGLATFTLATCFIKAGCSRSSLVCYIGFFSLVTPFGIFCGALLTTADEAIDGILVGLAGGSFLYIGVLEVISKEMESSTDKVWKLVMILLGCGFMSLLAIWV